MIFLTKPQHFSPRFQICSCFIEYQNLFLFLHRLPNKSQGNKWAIPAGKKEKNETSEITVRREIKEETSIDLSKTELMHVRPVYITFTEYDFLFEIFWSKFNTLPKVSINKTEHQAYTWVTLEKALELTLTPDHEKTIELFKQFRSSV